MLSILKLFVISLIIILAVSALCGVAAFFVDLHNFKSEKDLSLPRKRLIAALYEEQELKRKQTEQQQETPQTAAETAEQEKGW